MSRLRSATVLLFSCVVFSARSTRNEPTTGYTKCSKLKFLHVFKTDLQIIIDLEATAAIEESPEESTYDTSPELPKTEPTIVIYTKPTKETATKPNQVNIKPAVTTVEAPEEPSLFKKSIHIYRQITGILY